MRALIQVFAKAPQAGLAKTRLIPFLGSEGAAALARLMLERTMVEAAASGTAEVALCVTPAPADPAWQGLLPQGAVHVTDQGEGDLGERMARASERALETYDAVVLIGTDCPAIDRQRLAAAVGALRDCDAFIHPALDGGYALLALRRFSPSLFSGIAWSGPDVCGATLDRLHRLGWRVVVGDTLRDVDEPDDVRACYDAGTIAALRSVRAAGAGEG